MSTYIQVNIYNQTLDVLQMRGLDLKLILKTIGCPDTWITEVPIPEPLKRVSQQSISSSQPDAETKSSNNIVSSIPPTTVSSNSEESENTLKKPFKSISAEIGFIQPLNLADALGVKPKETTGGFNREKRGGIRGLFDEWDPTANLDTPGTSSGVSGDQTTATDNFKIPKEEIPDEKDEMSQPVESSSFELDDSVFSNEQERSLIQELFRQQNIPAEDETPINSMKEKRKPFGEESEGHNNYVISCNYPGCGLQYNWRVKYGKLRLLDHALTHSDRKIPCKLCGFECTNVRRMRSHYAKAHPNERVEGYGMKALVSGDYGSKGNEGEEGSEETKMKREHHQQVSDEELKALWNTCYSESIHLVGQATGFVEGEKYRRMSKRRKIERESINPMNFLFES